MQRNALLLVAGVGFHWFWALWGALLLAGWLPLALLLGARGWARAALVLGVVGNLWCLPMFLVANMLGEPAGEIAGSDIGDFLEFLLVGGGIGLVLGGLALAWRSLRGHGLVQVLALPLSAALAGTSFYPLIAATGVGGHAFRQTRGGILARLSMRGDEDGRIQWLAHYGTPGATFMIVMLDAQSGDVLCVEEAAVTAADGRRCHWGPVPRS